MPQFVGQEAGEGRFDVLEQVGHAGQVGEDVVAVGSDHRRQLAEHEEQLEGDEQQDGVLSGSPTHTAAAADGDDGVEVQTAEIDDEASPASQPVRVR